MFKLFVFLFVIVGYPTENLTFVLKNAGQFDSPWFVLLKINNNYCGGSLIKNQYIVTAAHCFDDVKNDAKEIDLSKVKITFGEWKTDTNPDCDEYEDDAFCDEIFQIPANKIVVHENYIAGSTTTKFENDISIIKLKWPPRPSEAISNIELPEHSECGVSELDKIWTLTGFGFDPDTKENAKIKKKVEMKIISHEECEKDLGKNKNYYNRERFVCGKGTDKESTCKGDSGSGLSAMATKGLVLKGLVSFGTETCGTEGVSSGFLKVSCYIPWINTQIEKLN